MLSRRVTLLAVACVAGLAVVAVILTARKPVVVLFTSSEPVSVELEEGQAGEVRLTGSAGGSYNFDYYASDVECSAGPAGLIALRNVGVNSTVAEFEMTGNGAVEFSCIDDRRRRVELELVAR